METKEGFLFEIIINVLVWISMLYLQSYYIFYLFQCVFVMLAWLCKAHRRQHEYGQIHYFIIAKTHQRFSGSICCLLF